MEARTVTHCVGTSRSWIPKRDLETVAIQHVLVELMKVLQCITPAKHIDSRNRMEISNGMFGLSLKMFFERRTAADVGFLNNLRIVCPSVLQNAKNCIVLDDLHDLICRLAAAHKKRKLRPVLTEITQSAMLLGIHEEIANNLEHNQKQYNRLHEELKSHQGQIRTQTRMLDLKAATLMDEGFETRLINGPIVFRYSQSFEASFQNCYSLLEKEENDIRREIDTVAANHNREIHSSLSVRMMLEYEINDFKQRLKAMEAKYNKDMDEICSLQGYMINSIDMIESRKRDCRNRLVMFAEEVPILIQWIIDFEEKKKEEKRQAFLKLLQENKKAQQEKQQQKEVKVKKK